MNIQTLTAFLVDNLGNIRGKKAYQKLVYLSKAMGIPVTETYKMYYYGPYSEQVANSLDECINTGILSNENESVYFKPGKHYKEVLDRDKESIKLYNDKLLRVVDLFGNCDPMDLEILSTTHFVYNNMKYLYDVTNKEQIIEEVKKAKFPKFSLTEINEAYEKLEKYKLLS